MFAFGFDEDQRSAGRVQVPLGGGFGPVLAHLGRRGDRIRAGGVGAFAFAKDDGGVAVDGRAGAGEKDGGFRFFHRRGLGLQEHGIHWGRGGKGGDSKPVPRGLIRSPLGSRVVDDALANDFSCRRAFPRSGVRVQPEDRAGRTTQDRRVGRRSGVVVDHRQAVFHRDPASGVRRAAGASGAGDFALFEHLVPFGPRRTSHPQAVADRVQGEQAFGARRHAVAASGAAILVDDGNLMGVHFDRVVVAGDGAVGQAQASPETGFSAPGDQSRGGTGFHALVVSPVSGDVV